MRRLFCVLLFVLASVMGTEAATLYVRDGGTSGSCTGWATANACDQLTTAISVGSAGDTIWVADGTYTAPTINKGVTITKATATAHGTDTGWLSTYGDGQATIGGDIT